MGPPEGIRGGPFSPSRNGVRLRPGVQEPQPVSPVTLNRVRGCHLAGCCRRPSSSCVSKCSEPAAIPASREASEVWAGVIPIVYSRAPPGTWLQCTKNVFQLVNFQARYLELMLQAVSSQCRRICCSPLEVLDLHSLRAAVSTVGPSFCLFRAPRNANCPPRPASHFQLVINPEEHACFGQQLQNRDDA